MTLPDVCPKDGVSSCKTSACHLYIVDWRSGDEQCIIGYSSTHKRSTSSRSVEDTYAESARRRTGKNIGQTIVAHPSRTERPERSEYVERTPVPESPGQLEKPEVISEKVVVKNKDTMVFESTSAAEDTPVEDKKRKTIDDVMNLDLPDDYEEEFWK